MSTTITFRTDSELKEQATELFNSLGITYPAIVGHFKKIPASAIMIPEVVVAEIEYGARKSRDYQKTMERYLPFINVFEKVPFGGMATQKYGVIRANLEKDGHVIGANDMQIAATALAEGGTLVTHNTGEFERIQGLLL